MSSPRFLLVQIRDTGGVRREEVESFCRHGGLDQGQVEVLNVFDTPAFEPEVAAPFDGVLVGGASEASVLEPERYPFVRDIMRLLGGCVRRRQPVFASCFGFQVAVLGLGGHIQRDEADFEMGTIPLQLTPAAAADPLYGPVPDGFLAVSCHRERAVAAPERCTVLAFSEACVHSFRVDDAPFWAFQFHPELDRQRFIERLGVFRSGYTDSDDHYERTVARFHETPESNGLVRRFVQGVASGTIGG